MLVIIGLFIIFMVANIFALKNKELGRHIIIGISLIAIFSVYNIPSTPPDDIGFLLMMYLASAIFSMLSLLILVPNNAKYNGKNPGLWAFLTAIGGPISAIVYYGLTYLKKENK